MIYLNLFSKDPNSIWSKQTRIGKAKYGLLAAILLGIILVYGIIGVKSSSAFLTSSNIATAHYKSQTSAVQSGAHQQDSTKYTGIYDYEVQGKDFTMTSDQTDKAAFPPARRVVYKIDNPGHAQFISSSTPALDLLTLIAGFLIALAGLFTVMYTVAYFS